MQLRSRNSTLYLIEYALTWRVVKIDYILDNCNILSTRVCSHLYAGLFQCVPKWKKWRFTSCSVEIVDKIEISCAPDFTKDNYNSLPNKGNKLVSNICVLKWP